MMPVKQGTHNLFARGGSGPTKTTQGRFSRLFKGAQADPAINDNSIGRRNAVANDEQRVAKYATPEHLTPEKTLQRLSEGGARGTGQDLCLVTLYHEYSSGLIAHVRKIVGDADEAADIVHGLFVSIMEKNSLHSVVNPRGFLYRAAHNAALDHLRSAYRANRVQTEKAADEYDYEDKETVSVERAVIGRQDLSIVLKALNALSPRERQVLIDYHIDGRAWAEVARSAGVSIRTAQNDCRRALVILKNKLGDRC